MANLTDGEKSRLFTHQSAIMMYEEMAKDYQASLDNPNIEADTKNEIKGNLNIVQANLASEKQSLDTFQKQLNEKYAPGIVEEFLKKVAELINELKTILSANIRFSEKGY